MSAWHSYIDGTYFKVCLFGRCGVGKEPDAVLAELRRRKDNFGISARFVTGALGIKSAADAVAKAIGLG